jgi:hypothetical protein
LTTSYQNAARETKPGTVSPDFRALNSAAGRADDPSCFLLNRVRTPISHLMDLCCGRMKRWTLLRIFIPLILLSYFGSLALTICLLPGPFDWRTRSMSKLLYPMNNPQFHAIPSAGLALTGLLTIPFAGWTRRRLRIISPLPAEIGAVTFGAGAISLVLCAFIVLEPFLHELFARSAAICVGVGMLAFYSCVLTGVRLAPDESRAWLRIFVSWSLIVPPALLILVLRLLAAAHFQWSNPIYQAIENRAFWHLGFWEWIGSTAVFLFLTTAALFLPEGE